MTPVRIDRSPLTVLAVCDMDGCPWRATRPTSAAAWSALAHHLKAAHDDPHAVARVRESARAAAARHG